MLQNEPQIALTLPLSAANVVLEGLMLLPLGQSHAVYSHVHAETSRQVEEFKAATAGPTPVRASTSDIQDVDVK